MAAYMAHRRAERRSFIVAQLGGKCARCGSTERLETDHIDPTTKSLTIANMLSHSIVRLLAELEKCQLLCKPCHTDKSKAAGEYQGGQNRLPEPAHGTAARYNRTNGCRCERCKEAKRLYRQGNATNREVVA